MMLSDAHARGNDDLAKRFQARFKDLRDHSTAGRRVSGDRIMTTWVKRLSSLTELHIAGSNQERFELSEDRRFGTVVEVEPANSGQYPPQAGDQGALLTLGQAHLRSVEPLGERSHRVLSLQGVHHVRHHHVELVAQCTADPLRDVIEARLSLLN